ncbi:MAG: SOS response-associated peptidase family protein [Sphingomonadaceae bacterium]|nr:SOS response-associated peptidase family protein [Sphingomonadaceae bacterium]
MCNLYTLRKSAAEVAAHFGVKLPSQANAADEVYPGYTGMVIREEAGERVMQPMTWGFPMRLKFMKPDSKPRPVNNCADMRKSVWVGVARKPQWRCIIPVTSFAEAEGPKGAKTRTWFTLRDRPLFGWAGLWRQSEEWGAVYTGVMTDCNEAIRPVHDRMPVLLLPEEYDAWLRGDFDEALAFQERCFPDDFIAMERTSEMWAKPRAGAGTAG